jgi:hypothetical protein
MSVPTTPPEIEALYKKYRAKGVLSALEVQTLLDWQSKDLDQRTQSAKEAGDLATLQMDDIVEFIMPKTTQGGVYTLNHPYFGKCQAPYAVFLELMRMHEQDVIGLQELVSKRGEAAFGLKDYIEFVVPRLNCRLVQRAEKAKAA